MATALAVMVKRPHMGTPATRLILAGERRDGDSNGTLESRRPARPAHPFHFRARHSRSRSRLGGALEAARPPCYLALWESPNSNKERTMASSHPTVADLLRRWQDNLV